MTEQLEKKTGPKRARTNLPRLTAIAAVLAAAGVVAWVIVDRNAGSSSHQPGGPVTAKPVRPIALSATGLATLAHAVGQPIYWAGPKQGYLYELTRKADGSIYLRYLPSNVPVGSGPGKYLLVATYPLVNAYQGLLSVSHGHQIRIPGGGIALVDSKDPHSVHFAYPGVSYQGEVYDPSPATARSVAGSGAVRPVG